MSCLNVKIEIKYDRPEIRCSLVCGISMNEDSSFSWSKDIKLLWDNGEPIKIDDK